MDLGRLTLDHLCHPARLYHVCSFKETGTAWPWHIANQLTQFLVLFWAAVALLGALQKRRLSQHSANVLVVLLVLFDLWSYGLKNVRPGRTHSPRPGQRWLSSCGTNPRAAWPPKNSSFSTGWRARLHTPQPLWLRPPGAGALSNADRFCARLL